MKKLKKAVSFVLAVSILSMPINIFASEPTSEFLEKQSIYTELKKDNLNETETYASPVLTICELSVGIADNGVSITYITRATENANEIGIKDLVLQEKTSTGWKNISIGTRCEYNTERCAGSMVYTGAVKGRTYRVSGTHYAKFGSTEKTLSTVTEEIVYN